MLKFINQAILSQVVAIHLSDIKQKAANLLRDTKLEIIIGLSVGAIALGALSYHHEKVRADRIPLAFSEISRIEDEAHLRGESVNTTTNYLAFTNDGVMNIFEAWNNAHDTPFENPTRQFASELEIHVDPAFKVFSHELPDLIPPLKEHSNSLLKILKPLTDAGDDSYAIARLLDRAWSESHVDHYRTVTETVQVSHTDSKGRNYYTTEIRTRQVYDHTTHTYNYHSQAGEKASIALDNFVGNFPNLRLPERPRTASKTGAENEYAMTSSRKNDKKAQIAEEDFLKIAALFATGSTMMTNEPTIISEGKHLGGDSLRWAESRLGARSTSYDTNSRIDSGPKEFQVAMNAQEHASRLTDSINDIVGGIVYTRDNSPALYEKIKQFIYIELNHKGYSKQLSREIMDMSMQMYQLNFKKGLEVDRFRPYMVALFVFIGAVAGGVVGYGIDYFGDRMGWYTKISSIGRKPRY